MINIKTKILTISSTIILNSYIFGATTFCSAPTFSEEFNSIILSSAWKKTDNVSFDISVSLFSSANISVSDGNAVLTLKKVATTDNNGVAYISSSGELVSAIEFSYGKYEFRIKSRGLDAVSESILLIWDGDDYDKHHEYMGFDLTATAYMSNFSTSPTLDGKYTTYHQLDTSGTKLSLKFHRYTIDYTPTSIVWYFDGEQIREEFSSSKTLPTKNMKIVFRNWLKKELQYNITAKDFPVETLIDSFEYTPIDVGGKSCKKIELETNITSITDENSSSLDENSTFITSSTTFTQLKTYINSLPENANYLIGFGTKISDLTIFNSAKVVWINIDGEWRAYSPYSIIRDTLIQNNIEIFSEIPQFTGFWIQK